MVSEILVCTCLGFYVFIKLGFILFYRNSEIKFTTTALHFRQQLPKNLKTTSNWYSTAVHVCTFQLEEESLKKSGRVNPGKMMWPFNKFKSLPRATISN